jgi:hypothetical protein
VTDDESYQAGANVTFVVVGQFKIFDPKFRFPPPEIALIASIVDVGKYLARNTVAHQLLKELMKECDRLKLGDYPTAMMLRVCLEEHNVPIEYVPFDELGIPGKLVRMAKGEPS